MRGCAHLNTAGLRLDLARLLISKKRQLEAVRDYVNVAAGFEGAGRDGRGQDLLEVAVDEGGAARLAVLLDDRGELVGDDLLQDLLVVEDMRFLSGIAHLFDCERVEIAKEGFARPA